MSSIESYYKDHHLLSQQEHNLNNYTFFDMESNPFRIKVDAILSIAGAIVEFKESPLNNKTTIESSRNKLLSQAKYHRLEATTPLEAMTAAKLSGLLWRAGKRHDCLLHAWNHSAYKHGIVHNTLAERGIDYIVVFKTHPPFVEYRGKEIPFRVFYKKRHNLTTMLQADFDEYLAELANKAA